MTITERLMKPGQFEVKLKPDAPFYHWNWITKHDHIVVTPTRLDPNAVGDAATLAAAIYSGVILSTPVYSSLDMAGREQVQRVIAGQGLAYWLGTEDGRGDLLDTAVTNTGANLSTWITSLRPSSLAAGTVTSPGGTWTYTYQWVTRREAIDHVCNALGAEWRVNPACTLDAAAPGTLFTDYTTPVAVITRKPEGYEGSYRGLEATKVEVQRDVDGYTTKVIVVGANGDGATIATGSATGSNVYKDFHNNNVTFERLVNSPDTTSTNTSTVATAVLNLYSSERKGLVVSTRTYAVPIRAKPGDNVWVYDPLAGLTDSANQITWRGELITPVKLRVKSYTYPIERGMGVYVRRSGSTATYLDITDYVEYETGDTLWEVGTSYADRDQDPTQLSPAYLGVNGDILDRASLGKRVSFTPSWSGTLGNGTLTGSVQCIGDWARVYIALTWGSTTSHGASAQTFGVPSGLAIGAADGTALGSARLVDSGLANYSRTVVRSGTTVSLMSEGGTFVTNTVPFTWTTNDQVLMTFDYPI